MAMPAPVGAEPIVQTVENHSNDVGEIEKRAGDYVHRPSGYVYPGKLAEMPARKTIDYGPGDAEVYYTLLGGANGDPWISLYVYPATIDVAAEARNVDDAIAEHLSGQATAAPVGLPPGPTGALDKWYRGTFDGVEFLTGYRVTRQGNWFIKARISIPNTGGDAAITRAMRGMSAIPWVMAPRSPTVVSVEGPAKPALRA
jgi:hypothetical protein